jgi:hypothetical protein
LEVSDIHKVEDCIKMALKDRRYRYRKEIYEIDLDILKNIFTSCDVFVNQLKKYFIGKKAKSTNEKFKEIEANGGKVLLYIEK